MSKPKAWYDKMGRSAFYPGAVKSKGSTAKKAKKVTGAKRKTKSEK